MSFDIFLLKFSKDDPACELPRSEFCEVIQQHDVRQRDEHFYDIHLKDGSFVEVHTGSPPHSNRFTMATFFIRGMSDSIVRLIYDCARATGGVLIPTMEQNPCILVNASQQAELPPDFTQPLVRCDSAEELSHLLRGGYQTWSRYRDQIVQGHDKPPG